MSKNDIIALYEPKQLDERSLKRSKEELNEKDAKQVSADIEYIRKWIGKQEHLKSKTDDAFILAFLRTAKFSYAQAQQFIENFWTNRVSISEFFYGRNYEDDSVLMEIGDLGYSIVLPVPDNEGRKIFLNRPGVWDTEKYDFDDMGKYMLSTIDLLVIDPRVQINGVVLLLDLANISATHASNMTPARAQKFSKCIEQTYPMRVKEIHFYNYPKIFDSILVIVKMFMSDKIKKRLFFHQSDLASLHKGISKKFLPKEYGGEQNTINNLNENWVTYLSAKKTELKAMEKYGIDTEKAAKLKKTEESKNGATGGSTGTFRKLNVD